MKSKIMLGLATLAALVMPAVANAQVCHRDGDGDRVVCTAGPGYAYEPYNFYRRDDYRRDREQREWRERREHERREWREHHERYDR